MRGTRRISPQSRAPVAEGGVLMDVSPLARAFGISCPVLLTRRAWVAAVESVPPDERAARVRTLLWTYLVAAAAVGHDDMSFNVLVGADVTALKAVSGPAGAEATAITVMLQEEAR